MDIDIDKVTDEQKKRLSEALPLLRESDDLKDRFCTTVFQAETVFVALVLPLALRENAAPTPGKLLASSALLSILSLICGGWWLSARSRLLHRTARRTIEHGLDGKAYAARLGSTGKLDEWCFRLFLVCAALSALPLVAALFCIFRA